MKKRLLTLKDLVTFCEQHNLNKFSSDENHGEVIVVQTPGLFSIEGKSQEGLIPVSLKACHDMTNINGSHIEKEDMESALPSFQLRPILANIVSKDDGTVDFGAHDMEIISNPFDSDEEIINYKERPVGIVFGDTKLVYDEQAEVDRVVVNGFLYEDYGNLAIKILESRGGNASVSVELCIREMSYNAKDKVLNITDFYFDGVTLLGEDIKPGMVGSDITLQDFSMKNNSLFTKTEKNEMIERLDEIKTILFSFNINNTLEKGGNKSVKLQELLAKYSVSEDSLTFEIDGLSDEELEAKFAEVYGEDDEPVVTSTTEDESQKKKKKKCSLNEDGTMSVTFEVSHEDIRYALYNLLYSVEENDEEYYYINAVYDGYFVYSTWDESKIFKHGYSVDGDDVAIADERTQLFKEYLTTSEKSALDEMRSNYSAMENKIAEYEAAETRVAKNKILSDEVYSELSESDAFIELSQNIDTYSVEEIQTKADLILAKHVKEKGTFAYSKSANNGKIGFSESTTTEKKKPYGSLFK